MATARLLGRTTALAGVAEEISVGAGLTFSALNLAWNGTSPVITTDIRPVSHDGASLGTAALGFSDLWLGTDGKITFGAASTPDMTITHSNDMLTIGGSLNTGSFSFGMDDGTGFPYLEMSGATPALGAYFYSAAPAGTGAANDFIGGYYGYGRTSTGDLYLGGGFEWYTDDATNGSFDSRVLFVWVVANSPRQLVCQGSAFSPNTTDTVALGTSSKVWSDLFLGSGAKIDFNGDVTITHSADTLTFSADSYVFGAPTGGAKGAGTINAVAVYDDNTLLTDYVFDYWQDGALSADDADNARALAFNPAHLDIDTFTASLIARRALPAMLRRSEWTEETRFSVGGLAQRLWETVEIQAVHIAKLNERLKTLEAKIE